MLDYQDTPLTPSALRPSEYTAALIHALQMAPERVSGADVLEIGSGSGVVLAALAELGARSLCGIDVEDDAVLAGSLLLRDLGYEERSLFQQGDMWLPVESRRFDLIAANLPHFAMEDHEVPGRHMSWSAGGPTGRRLLDPFLRGLRDHLVKGGRAVVTHNAFVGLELTAAILAESGLSLNILTSVLVALGPEKLSLMAPEVLLREQGKTIYCYGPYAFADMHVIEITVGG